MPYVTMSWTYLDLRYRFGRRIGGDDYPNIRLSVAQGSLLWQPVKLGDMRRHRQERFLLFALAIDNGLADHKFAFERLNGSNPDTSCTNLLNFLPIITKFTLLRRTIFAAIRRN